jgi:hypothetical protein
MHISLGTLGLQWQDLWWETSEEREWSHPNKKYDIEILNIFVFV